MLLLTFFFICAMMFIFKNGLGVQIFFKGIVHEKTVWIIVSCICVLLPNQPLSIIYLKKHCMDHSNEEKCVCITVCLLILAVDKARDEVTQPQILACHQTALFTSVRLSLQCYLRAGFRQTSIDSTAIKIF